VSRQKQEKGRYVVRDVERLKRLVSRLVASLGDGSLNAAASELGISQPTLWRLHEGKSESVSRQTMSRLEKGALRISRRWQRELMLCTMSPEAFRRYRTGYLAWCKERQERLLHRRGVLWVRAADQPPQVAKGLPRSRTLAQGLNATIDRARTQFPEVFAPLAKLIMARGYPNERFMVAVVRMVEPLMEIMPSCFFEPNWQELTEADRRSFLLHGLAREKILLNREDPPQTRANKLTRRG
jgi:hypothetical protein